MLDQSLSKSKDLDDMLRFLPGVVLVVQRNMSNQGMTDLYRIKPDLLERLIEPLRLHHVVSPHLPNNRKMDDYVRGFLQDRDRSQHYYCDPMLQHMSICRRFLSLLKRSNAFNLQSYVLRLT